jgi:hypothetical protein
MKNKGVNNGLYLSIFIKLNLVIVF